MRFELNPCVCGADDSDTLMDITDVNFHTTDAHGLLLRCRRCGSLRPDRFPDAASLPSAYADYYTSNAAGAQSVVKRALNWTRRDYLDRSIAPTAQTVLDYGCGSGAYLDRLAAAGHPAARFGCDLFPPSASAQKSFTWLSMDDFDADGRRYDHITLSHVLEHTRDPQAVIDRVARALNPGGILWIATPNAHSPMFATLGPAARDVDFPRHRIILSRKALAAMLERNELLTRWLRSPLVNTVMTLQTSLANARALGAKPSLARLPAAIVPTAAELVALAVRA